MKYSSLCLAVALLAGIAIAKEPPKKVEISPEAKRNIKGKQGIADGIGKKRTPLDVDKATLAEALEDFILSIEIDDVDSTDHWAGSENAKKSIRRYWDSLKRIHEKRDYRSVAKSAKPGAKRYILGGHAICSANIEWEKTKDGWRLTKIWHCR